MYASESPITVVLATDSFLIGDGLASLLAEREDVRVVGRARDHVELIDLVAQCHPDAVIISIRTPVVTTMDTIVAARRLRAENHDLGIVVISDRGDGFALELLRGGSAGIAYLLDERLPSVETVLGAIRDVRDGQTVLDPSIVDALVQRREGLAIEDLTAREINVLEQMAHGLTNRAIAAELFISVKAVEKYVTTIFRKLGFIDHGLVDRRIASVLTYLRAQATSLDGKFKIGGSTSQFDLSRSDVSRSCRTRLS